MKFVPATVSVKPGPPAAAETGAKLEMVGAAISACAGTVVAVHAPARPIPTEYKVKCRPSFNGVDPFVMTAPIFLEGAHII